MKHNYYIVDGEDRSLFYIKERNTGHIIKTFKILSEARKFIAKLNSGCGFNGWTPEFIIK